MSDSEPPFLANPEPHFDLPDWHSRHIPNWTQWLDQYIGKPQTHALEIGSCEGRSALWLLNNVLTHETSGLKCVDPFLEEGMTDAGIPTYVTNQTHENFNNNVLRYPSYKVTHFRKTSFEYLVDVNKFNSFNLQVNPRISPTEFEIIYIDGSHLARDVLSDIVLAWPLLVSGGTMILDDYDWRAESGRVRDAPRMAIDAFLSIYMGEYEALGIGVQVAVRKK